MRDESAQIGNKRYGQRLTNPCDKRGLLAGRCAFAQDLERQPARPVVLGARVRDEVLTNTGEPSSAKCIEARELQGGKQIRRRRFGWLMTTMDRTGVESPSQSKPV